MFRLSTLSGAIALGLLAFHAGSQAQDDGPTTLQTSTTLSGRTLGAVNYGDQVKRAILVMAQDHPEVMAAQASLTAGGFEAETAKRGRYPRLSVATASGRSTTFISQNNSVSRPFTAVTASVRSTLIDAGGLSARVKAAEANASSLEEGLRSTVQKVMLDGITAYMQVLRFDLKKRIAAKSTQVLDEMTRAEQRKVDLGATGQSDARLAASRRAGAAAKRQEFDALLTDALAKFETYFKFTPNPSALPSLVAPKAWRIATLSEALQVAEANSAELAEAKLRVERANAVVEREKSARFPTIDGVISKSQDNRGLTVEPTRAALELNFNVGNGFDIQSRIKAALVDVAAQEAKVDASRANVTEVTSGSWYRTQSGQERVKQLTDAAAEAKAAYQSKRRLLAFGRETLTNVLDAQLEYYNLLLDQVDALADLRIAEFRLARTAGRLMVTPEGDNAWVNQVVSNSTFDDSFSDALQEVVCKTDTAGCGSASVSAAGELRNPTLKQALALKDVPGASPYLPQVQEAPAKASPPAKGVAPAPAAAPAPVTSPFFAPPAEPAGNSPYILPPLGR